MIVPSRQRVTAWPPAGLAHRAKKLLLGPKPLAGRFTTSQSRRLPRPPKLTVPVPMPPRGRAMRARWSWS